MVRPRCKHGVHNNGDLCKNCKREGIGGKNLCDPHLIQRSRCEQCGGTARCKHGKINNGYVCKDCKREGIGGKGICHHERARNTCKECEGGSRCEHKRIRSECRECEGGSRCEHKRIRSKCRECEGGSRCEHKKLRRQCRECDLHGYLAHVCRIRIHHALKQDKDDHTFEYIGCSIGELKEHIEKQFKEGMTWENKGEWHIDHIIPIKYGNPSLEEVIERLHYTNLQPLWAGENISKGNRYIG